MSRSTSPVDTTTDTKKRKVIPIPSPTLQLSQYGNKQQEVMKSEDLIHVCDGYYLQPRYIVCVHIEQVETEEGEQLYCFTCRMLDHTDFTFFVSPEVVDQAKTELGCESSVPTGLSPDQVKLKSHHDSPDNH